CCRTRSASSTKARRNDLPRPHPAAAPAGRRTIRSGGGGPRTARRSMSPLPVGHRGVARPAKGPDTAPAPRGRSFRPDQGVELLRQSIGQAAAALAPGGALPDARRWPLDGGPPGATPAVPGYEILGELGRGG